MHSVLDDFAPPDGRIIVAGQGVWARRAARLAQGRVWPNLSDLSVMIAERQASPGRFFSPLY